MAIQVVETAAVSGGPEMRNILVVPGAIMKLSCYFNLVSITGGTGNARTTHPLYVRVFKWSSRDYMTEISIGDVHAGVRLRLVGDAPALESPQHILSEAELPASWHNGGRGGVDVSESATVIAFSGRRALSAGESVTFKFELLLTPVTKLDP